MVKIKFTGTYIENLKEILLNEPILKSDIEKRVNWFENNPEDTRLDNHELTGKMEGKRSFSITGDIRIVYEKLGKNSIRFLAIGGHKKVYKTN